MEIENNRLASGGTQVSGQNAPVENQRTAASGNTATDADKPPSGGSDTVSLTGQAQQLRDLETQLTSRPVVDSQRVEAVRSAVENGSFTVNPERIADKLISLEQALTDAR